MTNVILVDDEVLSLTLLRGILEDYNNLNILGEYTDPLRALQEIEQKRPDVAFIDVSMPEMDGFQLAHEIINKGMDIFIVFITAHDEYAIRGFEVEALDYIIKPFSKRRIYSTVERILKKTKKEKAHNGSVESVISNQSKLIKESRIPVIHNETIILLETEGIRFCTVEDKNTLIYTEKDYYGSDYTLTNLEERLKNKTFFRCHKSYLVNLEYIEKIITMFNQTYIIEIKGRNEEIPVSRHYGRELRKLLEF